MSPENIDYAAVLADMEAKRAALDAAIAGLRTYLSAKPGDLAPGANTPSTSPMPSGEVPAGAFLGKSIPEAAKLYLQIMKRKSTSKDIAEALRRGGIESTSNNFQGIVHAVLDRARKSGGEIVKIDRSHWGLAEWYPAGVRVTAANGREKRHKKGKKRPYSKSATTKQAPLEKAVESTAQKPGQTPQKLIEAYFVAHPDMELSASAVASALKIRTQTVALIAGKLAFNKWLEKTPAGSFRRTARRTLFGGGEE